MDIIADYSGISIRLTDERLQHISNAHPSLLELPNAIAETLASPDVVRLSSRNGDTRLYYRWYTETKYNDKYVCVVVVVAENDAWTITAYLTDAIKRGELLWEREM